MTERTPHNIPKLSKNQMRQLNTTLPNWVITIVTDHVYNPFLPINQISDYVGDAILFSAESWGKDELSPATKRKMFAAKLAMENEDTEIEDGLYERANKAIRECKYQEAMRIIPHLSPEHQEIVRKGILQSQQPPISLQPPENS